MLITNVRHPYYNLEFLNWQEWRLTYEGGFSFLRRYLEKLSDKEKDVDYNRRLRLTPVPAFAKMAVDEIKNAIFQRLTDVTREGGPESYQMAINGDNGGVDLHGSTMSFFMGETVLLELLIMGRVGVYVDSPPAGETLADDPTPYVYRYRVEDILSWTYHPHKRNEFSSVLLRDYDTVSSDGFGLPNDVVERYRLLTLTDEGVRVQFYEQRDKKETLIREEVLPLPAIPFSILTLPHSIIADVTRHQIALTNLESADIANALSSSFPTYLEQRSTRDFSHFTEDDKEIELGPGRARTYDEEQDPPSYIAPPSEPLLASMKKQNQLKVDLRQLVHLAVTNTARESAESKEIDQRGLEAGLSQIGLVLEYGERRIGEYWASYGTEDKPSVLYPSRYNLRSEADRREESENLLDLRPKVVSKTFQNELTYQAADLMIGHKTPDEKMRQIRREIEQADAYSGDVKTIIEAVDAGILDNKTAARLLGYPESVVEQAAKEHAERQARIAQSQAAARGNPDGAVDPNAASTEKNGLPGRGEGRFNGETS